MSCNPFKPKTAEWDRDFQREKIVAKDPRSSPKFQALNPASKNFNLFKVDGNLIDSKAQAKCDFLLVEFQRHQIKAHDCAPLHSYFIELKGTDKKRANEQVHRSIKELHPIINTSIPHVRIILKRNTTQRVPSKEERDLRFHVEIQMKGTYKQFGFNNNNDPETL